MNVDSTNTEVPLMTEIITAIAHDVRVEDMQSSTPQVIKAMKAMSHEVRLMLLWKLSKGEKTVTELANILDLEQSTVSQQLARLRLEGIVKGRRQGRTIHYHIEDERAQNLIGIICSIYCAPMIGDTNSNC